MQKIKLMNHLLGGFLILLALAFSAAAQTETKVLFPKGKTEAVYKGKLPRSVAEYDAYVFRARKGQTLSFELITDDPNAYVIVFETRQLGPAEDNITIEAPPLVRRWSGKLPLTSEYSVQVYGIDDFDKKGSGKPYTIRIAIAGK